MANLYMFMLVTFTTKANQIFSLLRKIIIRGVFIYSSIGFYFYFFKYCIKWPIYNYSSIYLEYNTHTHTHMTYIDMFCI